MYVKNDGDYSFWGFLWYGREQLLRKHKLNTYPGFVPVWILILSKDFVKIGDRYMKSAKDLLNILLRKENPWLYRSF